MLATCSRGRHSRELDVELESRQSILATISRRKLAKISPEAIKTLKSTLRGALLQQGDESYDEARRVYNRAVDRYPALIARCAGVDDIRRSLEFARNNEITTTVRAGGHNVAGRALNDGGLVIDLTGMRGMRVDPRARAAYAQPGLRYRDFDSETQAFGLATTGGTVSETGISGLTLGGGLGWLMRLYGMACDNLTSADVITSEGDFLTANHEENPDLFWALRGGGGQLESSPISSINCTRSATSLGES